MVEEESVVPVCMEPELPEWENEPKTVEELLELYVIEGKCPANVPGGMFYLVNSTTRKGEEIDIVKGQRFKLYFVPQFQTKSHLFIVVYCSLLDLDWSQ